MFKFGCFKAAGLGVMFLLGLPPSASAGLLGVAGEYGEFVFGSSSRSNTSSQGPVAVGGSASFSSFSIANSAPVGAADPNLVVGGSLSFWNGSLAQGSGYVAGAASVHNVGFPGGGSIQGGVAPPIDFSAEQASLAAISAAQYSADDVTVTPLHGSLTFGAANATGLQVFNVSAYDLSHADSFKIKGKDSSTVIINVLGSMAGFQNADFKFAGGVTSSRVLWNFIDAGALSISGVGVNGTILAPLAVVTFSDGQVNGSLIAASLSGSGATRIVQDDLDTRFTGIGRSGGVPEPASLAMLGTAAVVGLGLAAARRRRTRGGA